MNLYLLGNCCLDNFLFQSRVVKVRRRHICENKEWRSTIRRPERHLVINCLQNWLRIVAFIFVAGLIPKGEGKEVDKLLLICCLKLQREFVVNCSCRVVVIRVVLG